MAGFLKIYKRHLKSCPDRLKGFYYIGCNCPFWSLSAGDKKRSLGTSSLSEVLALLRDQRPEVDHELRYMALELVHASKDDGQFVYVVKPELSNVVKIGVAADVQ